MKTDSVEKKEKKRSGQLKIFFGYAAGVGKTDAMLKAACGVKRRGLRVVIGYMEPNAGRETTALMAGFPKLPDRTVLQNGILVHEFDPDIAIKERPDLVLLDEMAHTNARGSRHVKRYQDIEELLKAGIDVYTTLNVQNIESLHDVIAPVAGTPAMERVPDSAFDEADQVEFVDMEPEELMERLSGKDFAEGLLDRKSLAALREIALRRCADRINRRTEKAGVSSREEYYTDEHILVCLSSSPTNPKIIRTAARMAGAFRGNFTAFFVETPDFGSMSEENKKRLRENIRLAEQLGASVETVYGDDIPFQIAEFARLSAVSKVVMGRSSSTRKYFWSRPSLTERLTAYAPNLDIYIIPDQNTPSFKRKRAGKENGGLTWKETGRSVFLLFAATAIGMLFRWMGFSEANIITVYILGVLLTAVVTTQRIYSLVSSLVSVLTFNYFFTEPYYTLNASEEGYPMTFVIMFLSAFITSDLAVRMKQQMKQASEAAYRTKTLLDTNQLIQQGKNGEEIASVVSRQLVKLLNRSVLFYVVKDQELSDPLPFSPEGTEVPEAYKNDEERGVADWVMRNNKHAGATTGTFGNAACLYLAVRAAETVYGVVGIGMEKGPLDSFENNMMLSMLGECALAMENDRALRERARSELLAKNEQLRANLLRSISHDLRTPLTSISGNAGILLANEKDMDEEGRRKLYTDIYDDSLWLINLVENLLSVTRIEDGTMKLHMTAELIDEVVAEALKHINRKRVEHEISVEQREELLMARMDTRLIVQVIINIVDNAIKYTPPGSKIVISIFSRGSMVEVDIADNGGGIADEEKQKIFDMFYTVGKGAADSRRSLGLGLALCKSVIMAHGGDIFVRDNEPKGTVFGFTLPKEEVTLHE